MFHDFSCFVGVIWFHIPQFVGAFMAKKGGNGVPMEVDEILSTMRHDITSVETNLEESKAKLAMDTDHAPGHCSHCRFGWENDGEMMGFCNGANMEKHGEISWLENFTYDVGEYGYHIFRLPFWIVSITSLQ